MQEYSSDPLVGTLVDGRYLITSRLASGGMSTVYVATDQRLERSVALKVLMTAPYSRRRSVLAPLDPGYPRRERMSNWSAGASYR